MNPTKSERVDHLPVVIQWLSQMLSEQDSQAEKTSAPLLHKGYSKDHRPDLLLQYRQMLAALDPLGMPLVQRGRNT